MSFRYSYTFPISGPNKLPRFKQWASIHLPGMPVSLPPQVPVKANSLTIRLKTPEDREQLMNKLSGASL
jgi:hypothetical protein